MAVDRTSLEIAERIDALRQEARRHQGAKRLGDAEIVARQAVELDQGDARSWLVLGQISLDSGKLEESCRCFEQIALIRPDLPELHDTLGLALQRLDRMDLAEASFRRAIVLAPENKAYRLNLSALLARLGRHREVIGLVDMVAPPSGTMTGATVMLQVQAAIAEMMCGEHDSMLRRLAPLPPEPLPVQILRVHGLRKAERFDEALRLCGVLLKRPDAGGEVQAAYALVLQGLGRYDEAVAAFDAGIEEAEDPEPLRIDKAMLLAEFGQIAEALALLDDVLKRQPGLVPAWYNKSHLKIFGRDDPDIAAMRRLLETSAGPSSEEALWLHFALGKACGEAGDPERAIEHWHQGNALKRALVVYDADETTRLFHAITARFSERTVRDLAERGYQSEVPILIVGMPRSGTSLVEQILASHGQIHGAGEQRLLRRLAAGAVRHGRPIQPFPAWVDGITGSDCRLLGRWYLSMLRRLAPAAPRIIDKMPTNFLYAGLVHAMLPQARIIHCRRDPLDTCFSIHTKLFSDSLDFSYDLAELGHYYRRYEALMAHWRQVLPASVFIDVRYEDLVGNLADEARRLVDFCGLPWDENCLQFQSTRRQVRSASLAQVRRPLYRSSIGAADPFKAHLGPLIEALGLTAAMPPATR